MADEVSLPGVARAVRQAKEVLSAGADQLLALTGSWGSGKSTTLERLARELRREWSVVHVSPPSEAPDAAAIGLVSAAVQLRQVDTEVLTFVQKDKETWESKVDRVSRALSSTRYRCALLFDDPKLDPVPRHEATIFSSRAHELSVALLTSKCSRIVALTSAPKWLRAHEVPIESRSVPDEILATEHWNGLSQYAQDLLKYGKEALEGYSPLELRLAVALRAAGVPASEIVNEKLRRRELVIRLMATLSGREAAALRLVIGRLAVLRVAFDDQFLKMAGAGSLDPISNTMLHRALLFGESEQWQLHELLRREAIEREWLNSDQLIVAHNLAAQYHQHKFTALSTTNAPGLLEASSLPDVFRHEMEVIHHLTEAGDPNVLNRTLAFAEQYDALGKTLSVKKLHGDAVRAYERALELNVQDWYAHHYLAFNLDILHRQPERVESEYREAIKQFPEQPWYHGRFICFLLSRGRVRDARDSWNEALARLLADPSVDNSTVYENLHQHVARLLLYFGQLDFTEQVLEDVLPRYREALDWFEALYHFLVIQREAERDELVFPDHIPVADRWNGPHLLRDDADRARVESWMPGRIASIDKQVHIRVARLTGPEHAEYGWVDLSPAELRRRSFLASELSLPVGTFVEFVTLLGRDRKKTERILTHERTRPLVPALMRRPFPIANRYIVSATASDTE